MAKDPAVLFYTSDFLTGTILMNYEQRGKYITLLCLQHQKGLLSDKDMLNICISYDKEVYDKFIKTDDGYYNKRMKEEHEKRSNFSKSRSENRLKGIENQKNKPKKKKKPSYDNHMEDVNEDEIINYFTTNGYSIESAKKFFIFYSVAKWKDSNGNQVKNWKQKAQGVWFKPENKIIDKSQPKMVY